MKFLQEVYDENKKLDDMFDVDYDNYSDDTIRKNILELVVEIGEFCNETRCFKYWSNKKVNKELALEELADCILMVLYFYHVKDMNLDGNYTEFNDNLIDSFLKVFNIASALTLDINMQKLNDSLSYLIHISNLLDYSNDEVKEACLNKIRKNFSRFETQEFGKLK